jgi:hypothetical protein
MRSAISQRVVRLEQARQATAPNVILWIESDAPDATPERIELCGLSHEECLDLLEEDAGEALQ